MHVEGTGGTLGRVVALQEGENYCVHAFKKKKKERKETEVGVEVGILPKRGWQVSGGIRLH